MKNHTFASVRTLAALFLFTAFAPQFLKAAAADDCPKNADACVPGAQKALPFQQAAAAAEEKAKAPAAREKTVEAAKPAAAAPEPAAVPEVSTGTSARQPAENKLSSPAWLLFMAAVMAGLYFYLRGNAKRGRKR